MAVINDYMIEKHREHSTRNARCVLCVRFGPAAEEQPEVYSGRVVGYSVPVSANPEEW